MAGPKLTIELIPATTSGSNTRTLAPWLWDAIRKDTLEKAGHKCEICSSEKNLHCHEQWRYDGRTTKQILTGFQILCEMCHLVKHIGYAAHAKKLDATMEHLRKVNEWGSRKASRYVNRRLVKYQKIRNIHWEVDISYALERYKLEDPDD